MSNTDVIQIEVDLIGLFAHEDEIAKIESALQDHGITDLKNLVYTGVNGNRQRISQVLSNGIIKGKTTTHANTSAEMMANFLMSQLTPLGYADVYKEPAILVYNLNKLSKATNGCYMYIPAAGYTFRDALVAIVKLKTM